jgi:GDP-mannose 6-dehydrogenase
MRVSVFGLGYVGSVTAACLASDGHTVVGVDINPLKVEQIDAGRSPVIEPGLEELIAEGRREHRLTATFDAAEAVTSTDVSVICVGTPSNGNGSLHTGHVEAVARRLGEALRAKDDRHLVVIRSTVLPGTVENTVIPAVEDGSGSRVGEAFDVCVNPEFLREGSALRDYYNPSYVVIGERNGSSGDTVASLYERLNAPVIRTSLRTAEMVKYASNAFHALKVAFANEIGTIAKQQGIDGRDVMAILCEDRILNISPTYLRPGFAFGGSCLPKDVRALVHNAKQTDVDCPVLDSVLDSNQRHIARAIGMVESAGNQRVGVIGLSFKSGTDDVRESPVVALIETLVGRGYSVGIYDELVDPSRLIGANKASLERELPHIASLMRDSVEAVVEEAETVVVANNGSDLARVVACLRPEQHVVDLVGLPAAGRSVAAYDGICW